MIQARTKSVEDTRALGGELAPLTRPGDLLLVCGDLGAGKTAFTQGLGRGLGVEEPITSPTFILVRRYESDPPFVHVDVYRLDHLQEVLELGIAELIDGDAVVAIEWGDVVTPVLPSGFLQIKLELGAADDERLIEIRASGPRWSSRMTALKLALARWVVEEA